MVPKLLQAVYIVQSLNLILNTEEISGQEQLLTFMEIMIYSKNR